MNKNVDLMEVLMQKINSYTKDELKEFVEASPKWGCKSPSMDDYLACVDSVRVEYKVELVTEVIACGSKEYNNVYTSSENGYKAA